MDDARAQRLADYEHRFRRAGLPLLSEDFSARSDVFNRAFPLLALVLLAELIAALDVPLRPTTELLRVSVAIAALSGVYYAISVLTDDRYREEFLDEITGQLRETFVARAEYLALRSRSGAAG